MTVVAEQFVYPVRIHIEDTDYSGLVYHSRYLNFMERARSEWAEQIGMGIEWQRTHGIFLLVRRMNIDFLKPAHVHEKVEVVSCIQKIRHASLIYEQYLRRASEIDTILCKAEVLVACVNQDKMPRALPPLKLFAHGECR